MAVGAAGIALVVAGVLLALAGGEPSRLESALAAVAQPSEANDNSGPSQTSASANQGLITPPAEPEPTGTATTGAQPASTTSTATTSTPVATITASIAVGESPGTTGPGIRESRVSGMAAAEDSVWAVRPETGTLYRIDTSTHDVTASVQVGGSGTNGTEYSVALGFESVWATANDGTAVVRVDTPSNEAIAIVELGRGPEDLAVSDDAVWVIENRQRADGYEVARIDPTTNQVADRYPVTDSNFGDARLAFGHGSLWVLLSSGPTGLLLRVDPTNGSVLTTAELQCPGGLSVDTDSVWTTDQCPQPDGWRLLRIDPADGGIAEEIPSPINGSIATAAGKIARATASPAEPTLVWWLAPGTAEPQLLAIDGIDSIVELEIIDNTVWVATEGPASVIRVDGAFE